MAYATVSDLAARWRALSADELGRAAALLDDAAVEIDAFDGFPDDHEHDERQLAARLVVSCRMVKRAMQAGDGPAVTQQSETRGPFGAQVTYANPMGDVYLTKADRRLLAGRGGLPRAGSVSFLDAAPEAL